MGRKKKKRSRKKRKINPFEGEDPSPITYKFSPSSSDNLPLNKIENENNYRNWSDLSEPLLFSILNRLSSFFDLASAASVSHPWNFAASASSKLRVPPPLLLHPTLNKFSPRYRLQTLSNTNISKPFPFSQTLSRSSCVVGRSHSSLIFISAGSKVVLADVFTGKEITSPTFDSRLHVTFGTLTAPPGTPSCSVLLVARTHTSYHRYKIMSWAPARPMSDWAVLDLENSTEIVSLVVYKHQIYGFDLLNRIGVLEVVPSMSWKLLQVQLSSSLPILYNYGNFRPHFVECDGELLVVLLVPRFEQHVGPGSMAIEVYKLDFDKYVWEKKENLGNWCLFIDVVGNCGFSCKDPSGWGCRNNCVYVVGPGYDGCSTYPLNGLRVDVHDVDSPFHLSYLSLPRWPSPVWVCPSITS